VRTARKSANSENQCPRVSPIHTIESYPPHTPIAPTLLIRITVCFQCKQLNVTTHITHPLRLHLTQTRLKQDICPNAVR